MNIRIAIIDDLSADYNHLKDELRAWERITHNKLDLKYYDSPLKVLDDYQSKRFDFDLLFLDIMMPGINGIDLIKELQKTNPHILFILTSSNIGYADAGYSIYAFDFLPKPIQQVRLSSAMNRAVERISLLTTSTFTVNSERETFKLSYSDVMYFESKGNYVFIHTKSGDEIKARNTIKALLTKCPDFFIKINRSCIVNMSYVGSFTRDSVKLSRSDIVLPLSKAAYEKVQIAFERLN